MTMTRVGGASNWKRNRINCNALVAKGGQADQNDDDVYIKHVDMFASDKIFFQYEMAMMTLTIMMMATTMILRIMIGGHHIILGTNQNSSPHHIDSPHNRNQSQNRF